MVVLGRRERINLGIDVSLQASRDRLNLDVTSNYDVL
jgi:hypothetical protein